MFVYHRHKLVLNGAGQLGKLNSLVRRHRRRTEPVVRIIRHPKSLTDSAQLGSVERIHAATKEMS